MQTQAFNHSSSGGHCRAAVRLVLGMLMLMLAGAVRLPAQTLQAGQPVSLAALGWPRFYATNGYDFAIYQPSISAWPGNQLNGRFVVAVRPTGTTNESYGVVFFQARTDIDKVNRLVTFEDFQINRLNFPTQPGMQDQYRAMLLSFQQQTVRVIPLDHLEAVFAASADITQAKVQAVKNDPPAIFYSTQPSLLVLVDGPPVLQNLTGNYQRVVNTRAILLLDNNPIWGCYFLYADGQWYTAPAVAGPWSVVVNFPANINNALSAALNTGQVDPMYPKHPGAPPVTQVYVSTVPAELLEVTGAPNLVSIPNTDLLYVENTSNAIFYYLDDGNYYVLISGRWFKAGNLSGPWAFVPPGSLPGDFLKIPPDSDKSNVMLSVPGSPQAREAVIANSIPQTAAIDRSAAKLTAVYLGGAPSFMPIAGTGLYYAANSDTPVIMVAPNSYYACQGGLWFTAATATGPWVVATFVPSVIYTIPATCPIHYVTYAYVYSYTPTLVYVGYTPGYMGTVVAPGGVVVYGTGYYYPPVVVGSVYVSYPPTYGYGASFAMGAAVGFAFGFCAGSSTTCACQPHWGCYSYSYSTSYSYTHCNVNACNCYSSYGTAVHTTGSYGYNAYTGNEWASKSSTAYNPYTGTHASGTSSATYNPYSGNASAQRSGSAYNPYSGASASGSSSASANRYNGNYSGSKQGSAYNPTTGSSMSGSASTSGNAYNGTQTTTKAGSYNNANTGESASGQRTTTDNNGTYSSTGSGSASNSKTGASSSWSNGSMTSDKDGNTYSYNQGDTSQNKATAQSESSDSHPASSYNSDADRDYSAQSEGQDRANSFGSGGGGGWGGSHGGWGGGGGSGGWGGGGRR